MKKEADPLPGLTFDMLKDSLSRHALPAAGIGAGLAGLAHILALKKRQEEAESKKQDADTVIIEVPSKTAAPELGQYFWDAPLFVGSALAGGGAGYAIVNSILKKQRQKQLDNELESLKKQYSDYMSQQMSVDSKTAEYPVLDGLILSIADKVYNTQSEDYRKNAAYNLVKKANPGDGAGRETLGTMLTSLPGVAALLAGIGAHNYYYNRQKNIDRAIEKEEAAEMKSAPKFVKIVSKPVSQEAEQELLTKGASTSIIDTIEKVVNPDGNSGEHVQDPQEKARESRRGNPIVSNEDIQNIDPNTMVMTTDSGNVQLDALDPNALAKLEKYKKRILESFAVGFNS
jgi:hypothetical protein